MSPPTSAHQELFRGLARYLSGEATVQHSLADIADAAVRHVRGADMAGVTMAGEDSAPRTHAYTDERALAADVAQYRADRGPCLDAWREERVVHVPDIGPAETRYPEFVETARHEGILGSLSFPLRMGAGAIGALNLYAASPDAFEERDSALGSDLATVVGVVIATVTRYAEAVEVNENLVRAMDSRAAIEQAKGIIMASTRCSPDAAFAVLRQQSQTENRKLREVAEDIVRRHSSS